jgi:ABC-type multidrug transport system fused ATPase/permease subunit
MPQKAKNNTTSIIIYSVLAIAAVVISYYWIKPLFYIFLIIILLYIFNIVANERRKEKIQKQEERKNKRVKQLFNKFGEKCALLIYNKQIELGTTKEMVIAAFGNPQATKQTITTRYTKERCTWIQGDSGNKGKLRKKYGVFKNEILVEYGDR